MLTPARWYLTLTSAVLFASASSQIPFWDQPYDGASSGRPATRVIDNEPLSQFWFDSFVVPGTGVLMTNLTVYGTETAGADPSQTTNYTVRITRNASFTDPGLIYNQFSRPHSWVYDGGNLTFLGLSIDFSPGTYYFSVWAERPESAGKWLWRTTTPVRLNQAITHNPGGGAGFGTSPVPGSQVYAEQRDMAFTLYHNPIPEPSTVLAVIAGLSYLILRRRRS